MSYAYYPVIPCGQQSSIAFISNERLAGYPGFFIRFTSGVPAEFLGVCYHVDPGTVLPENVAIDWTPITGAKYETFTTCEACGIAPPPPAPEYVSYQFDACCGGTPLIYSINSNSIVDGDVYLYTGPAVGPLVPGCYTLTSLKSTVAFPFVDPVDLEEINSCADPVCQAYCNPCQCYAFTSKSGGGSVDALDCNGDPVTITVAPNSTSDKFCLSAILSLNGVVPISYGLCAFINGDYTCAACYTLLDCQGIVDPITSTNPALAQYAGTGQSIQIEGYDTCWNVIFDDKIFCDCAINATVQFVYQTCLECNYPQAYKVTECNTGDVIYTTSDLSAYINTGATLSLDCGGCWFIEAIEGIPPSDQPVTVIDSYTDCVKCNTTYYTLTKCGNSADKIYTVTDLSGLVGLIITLQFCPGECWQVTLGGQEGGIVLPENTYATCSDCMLMNNTCQCQTVTNNVGAGRRFNYYDCSGTLQFTSPLALGETTAKTCMLSFTNADPADVTNYGNCIDNECPPEPSPLLYRAVTPGYGTAACTTEYYETVECNFSEWMYKDVLEQRYGISNCCPDELMKWEIRHEMLMLDVLINPNYTCGPANSCGCPSSCNCGYISLDIIHPTCPIPSCVLYNIGIQTPTGGILHYKNCQGQPITEVIPITKATIQLTKCGINGQTETDIYFTGETVVVFTISNTGTSC